MWCSCYLLACSRAKYATFLDCEGMHVAAAGQQEMKTGITCLLACWNIIPAFTLQSLMLKDRCQANYMQGILGSASRHRPSADQARAAATALMELALGRGATDNITTVVLLLQWG